MKYKWKYVDELVLDDGIHNEYVGLGATYNTSHYSYADGSGGVYEFFENPWDDTLATPTFNLPLTTFHNPVPRPEYTTRYSHYGRGLYKEYFYRSYRPDYALANRQIDYCSLDGSNFYSMNLGSINGVTNYYVINIFEVSSTHIVVIVASNPYATTGTRFVVPLGTSFFTTAVAQTNKPALLRAPPISYGAGYFDDGTDLFYCNGTPNGFASQGPENMEPALPSYYSWIEQWNWYSSIPVPITSPSYEMKISTYHEDFSESFVRPYYTGSGFRLINGENYHYFPAWDLKLAHPFSGSGLLMAVVENEWEATPQSMIDGGYPIVATAQGEILRYIVDVGYRFKYTLEDWHYKSCEYYAHVKEMNWFSNTFNKVWYVDDDNIYAMTHEQDSPTENLFSLWKMYPAIGSAEIGPHTINALKTNNKYGIR